MRTNATEVSTIASYTRAKMDEWMERIDFRIVVFTISVAAGYGFTYLVYSGVHLLHLWSASGQDKSSPLAELLRTLHSGFSN
jgi:hypothetical protein